MDRFLRDQVWQRAATRCEYCLMPQLFTDARHEVDHVIAEKHRGTSTPENLALACFHCNNHKGPNIARVDPATGQVIRLKPKKVSGTIKITVPDTFSCLAYFASGNRGTDVRQIYIASLSG